MRPPPISAASWRVHPLLVAIFTKVSVVVFGLAMSRSCGSDNVLELERDCWRAMCRSLLVECGDVCGNAEIKGEAMSFHDR